MSTVLELDSGWFVDQLLSINKDYETTESFCDTGKDYPENELIESRKPECSDAGQLHFNERQFKKYECLPDLFAIWNPYMMDSQFNKNLHIESVQHSVTVASRNEEQIPCSQNFHNPDASVNDICKNIQITEPGMKLSNISENADDPLGKIDSFIDEQNTDFMRSEKKQKKRKRKHQANGEELVILEEHQKICHILTNSFDQLKRLKLERDFDMVSSICDNNMTARKAASTIGCGDVFRQQCQETLDADHDFSRPVELYNLNSTENVCNRLIEHPCETAVKKTLMGHEFLICPQSRFLISDFSCLEPLLIDQTRYDCIVIDPPWENKSVKRLKKYSMISDHDLLNLPLRHLCNQGAIVLVWVTNKRRQQNFVIERLFPAWNINYLTKWYWLKVTRKFEPICKLYTNELKKRPYECLMLGYKSSGSSSKHQEIPHDQVIISVPCSIHSRKPPLNEIVQKYLKPDAKCLELFARSLLPNWTSWGNEVLALQHIDLFKACTK